MMELHSYASFEAEGQKSSLSFSLLLCLCTSDRYAPLFSIQQRDYSYTVGIDMTDSEGEFSRRVSGNHLYSP